MNPLVQVNHTNIPLVQINTIEFTPLVKANNLIKSTCLGPVFIPLVLKSACLGQH